MRSTADASCLASHVGGLPTVEAAKRSFSRLHATDLKSVASVALDHQPADAGDDQEERKRGLDVASRLAACEQGQGEE